MGPFVFEGRTFYVKRDDLIDPRYSGNKARKFHRLFSLPSDRYDTLVSYGGAQSNAMLSLAHLAKAKGWRFEYHCKRLPQWLRREPAGNLSAALALGMELNESEARDFYEVVQRRRQRCGERELFVPQGGADPMAEEGVKRLADEVAAWFAGKGFAKGSVALPSGTGSTAFYLCKHLPPSLRVATVPVVGDADTLRNQWRQLDPSAAAFPAILPSPKWPFAKPRADFLQLWRKLLEAGIEFDMIYAPKTWMALLRQADALPAPILYIHTGGVSGNASQLEQYRYRKML